MKGVSRLATLARGLSKGFLLKSSRFLPVLVLTSSSERNVNHFFSTVFCLSFPAPAILHAILKRLHQVHNLAGLRGLEFKIVFFELVGFGKQPVGCPKQCFTSVAPEIHERQSHGLFRGKPQISAGDWPIHYYPTPEQFDSFQGV